MRAGSAILGRFAGRFTQCMSAFRYPSKNSSIIPFKITPTVPNIQKPSPIVNFSTTFLLPRVGEELCMGMVGQKSEVKARAVVPFRAVKPLLVIHWIAVVRTRTAS